MCGAGCDKFMLLRGNSTSCVVYVFVRLVAIISPCVGYTMYQRSGLQQQGDLTAGKSWQVGIRLRRENQVCYLLLTISTGKQRNRIQRLRIGGSVVQPQTSVA